VTQRNADNAVDEMSEHETENHRVPADRNRRRNRPRPPISPGAPAATSALLVQLLILLTTAVPPVAGAEPDARSGRLPGEFERQDAILIGWDAEDPIIRQVLITIVAEISPSVPVLIMVDDRREHEDAAEALRISGVPEQSIHLLMLPSNTIWARDFGPVGVQRREGCVLIDTEYADQLRPQDDAVPRQLARRLRLPVEPARISLQGGNLISNGQGILMTTSRILDENAERGYTYRDITAILEDLYGCGEIVLLEPLRGESTGHIDMFATFVSPQTVIIGELDERIDPVNSAVLERNARRLAQVQTPQGPLEVLRVPMPPPVGRVWRTYLNVLYGNGTLLVPVYAGHDPQGRALALRTFERALPDWKITPVDCSELIRLGGALHCITMNLGPIHQRRTTLPDRAETLPQQTPRKRLVPARPSRGGNFRRLPAEFRRRDP
jgi:agmatine/peptidylarginine deiminase